MSSTLPTALLLGGTGSLWLTALDLARTGWSVTVTGREAGRLPPNAEEFGITFVAADRRDQDGTAALVGDGADLLVDGQGYHPDQAHGLAVLSRRCAATVYLSAKAVYLDADGHHLNSPGGVRFDAPVLESTPTMAWAGQDPRSAEGYGAGAAESERILLAEGERLSVLRPSKIHGPWLRQPRLEALLDLFEVGAGAGGSPIMVAGAEVVESTTSAEVLARVVLACARAPGTRVLNVADADPRPAAELLQEVYRAAGVDPLPEVIPADRPSVPDARATDALTTLPWRVPMVLDTTALRQLGVRHPTFAETAWMEVEWLLRRRSRSRPAR